jgi:hypothetical protein
MRASANRGRVFLFSYSILAYVVFEHPILGYLRTRGNALAEILLGRGFKRDIKCRDVLCQGTASAVPEKTAKRERL